MTLPQRFLNVMCLFMLLIFWMNLKISDTTMVTHGLYSGDIVLLGYFLVIYDFDFYVHFSITVNVPLMVS